MNNRLELLISPKKKPQELLNRKGEHFLFSENC